MNKKEVIFAIRSELTYVQNMGYCWRTWLEAKEADVIKSISSDFEITTDFIDQAIDSEACIKAQLDIHRDRTLEILRQHHAKVTRTN